MSLSRITYDVGDILVWRPRGRREIVSTWLILSCKERYSRGGDDYSEYTILKGTTIVTYDSAPSMMSIDSSNWDVIVIKPHHRCQ